jgi:hypothetical protein
MLKSVSATAIIVPGRFGTSRFQLPNSSIIFSNTCCYEAR